MTPRTPTAPPRRTPPVATAAVALAVLLVAAAVVAFRELAVGQGWASGQPWLPRVVERLDGVTPTPVVLVVAVAMALIGLLLVLAALRPGSRTHLRASTEADVWLTPRALSSLAVATADRAAGVVGAEPGRASRRRVVVDVLTRPGHSGDPARAEVAAGPGSLTDTRVVVRSQEVAS